MKKILSLLLVFGLVFVGGSVSAYSPEAPAKEGMRGRTHKTEERQKQREDKQSQREDKQAIAEQRRAELEELFSTYNPEGLAEFEEVADAHQDFREEQRALRTEWRDEIRAKVLEVREQYQNGEITAEEYDALKAQFSDQSQDFHDQVKELRDQRHEELSVVRDQARSIHSEIEAMQDSGDVDSARMVELLNSITGLKYDHLVLDEKYAELIEALRINQ